MKLELNNVIDKYERMLGSLRHALNQKNIDDYIPAFAEKLQELFPEALIASLILKGDARIIKFHSNKDASQRMKESMRNEMGNRFKQLSNRFKNGFGGASVKSDAIEDGRMISDSLITIPFYSMGFPAGLFSVMLPQKGDVLPDADLLLEYCLTEHLEKTFDIINTIQEKASKDGLTDLYGRNYLSFAIRYFFDSKTYKNEDEACLLMDVDNFKNINDSYGHEIGDAVLIQIAEIIRENIPPEAIPIRFGGDEFVVLLPNADSAQGLLLAESLLHAVREHDFSTNFFSIRATLSIGVSGTDMSSVIEANELLVEADKGVYLAKKQGRNQVCLANSPLETRLSERIENGSTQLHSKTDSNKYSVLVVDDDPVLLEITKELLERGGGFEVEAFQSPAKALETVASNIISFNVLLTDLEMPEMNGLELVQKIRTLDENIETIIMTGYSSTENALSSLKERVYDFIEKPFDTKNLINAVQKAGEQSVLRRELDAYHNQLEEMLDQKTKELSSALSKTAALYEQTLSTILEMLNVHEKDSANHSKRVAEFTVILAEHRDIKDKSMLNDFKVGALLHDIGKIGIPVSILQKPEALSPEELDIMRTHPEIGFKILSKLPDMYIAAEIAYAHHECFDGSGYPRGLSGKKIPLGARIFALADTFDAMRFDRSYRKKCALDEIVAEVNKYSGTQFEPELVEVFNNCLDELEAKALEL